jgi:hypothetical protein
MEFPKEFKQYNSNPELNGKYSDTLQSRRGRVVDAIKENSDTEKKMQAEILDWYATTIEAERLREHKINKPRVFQHLESFGLPTPPNVLFLCKKDILEMEKIYAKYGYNNFTPKTESDGAVNRAGYDPITNVCYILLDGGAWKGTSEDEALDKESSAVHEAAHAARGYYNGLILKPDELADGEYNFTRIGFRTNNLLEREIDGSFFEEGFVRYIQKEYRQKYRPVEITEKISNLPCPAKLKFIESGWLNLVGGDKMTINPSNMVGVAMELLFKAKPELLSLFIKARNSDGHDGAPLQEIVKTINSLQLPPIENDGQMTKRTLYGELRKLKYNDTDAMKGLNLVLEALGMEKI